MNAVLEPLQRWAFDALPVLLDVAAKGMVLLAIARVLVLAMRKASAAARQVVWLLALAALLALPLASAALPSWRVLPGWARFDVPVEPAGPASPSPADAPPAELVQTDPLPGADQARMQPGPPSAPADDTSEAGTSPPMTGAREQAPQAATDTAAVGSAAGRSRWAWVVPLSVAIWLAGAIVCLLPLLLGRISLWWLARRSLPILSNTKGREITDSSWDTLCQRAAQAVGLRRRVSLLESGDEPMPMVWGTFRPKLLLPAEAARWPVERRWVVLLHELAHAKRRDCLAKLVAHVACAFYWFNPLCWMAFKLMQRESEAACDDLVLSSRALEASSRGEPSSVRPSDYAEHLLEIAGGLKSGMLATYSSIAMARKSKLEGRLLAILDATRNRRTLTRIGLIIVAALIAAVAIPLAVMKATGQDNSEVASLIEQLKSEDEATWEPAAERLSEMGPAVAEPVSQVFAEGGPGDAHAVQVLKTMAKDPDVQALMRKNLDAATSVHCSLIVLGKSANRAHVAAIVPLLEKHTIAASGALSQLGGDEAFEALLAALNNPDIEPRWLIVENLARFGRPEAIPAIKKALGSLTSEDMPSTAGRYVGAIHKLEGSSRPGAYSFGSFHAVGDRGWRMLEGINLDKMTTVYVSPFQPKGTDEQTRAAAYQALAANKGPVLAWDRAEGDRLLAMNGLKLAPFAPPALPKGYDLWGDGEKLFDQRQLAKIVETYNAEGDVPELEHGVRAYPFVADQDFLALLPDGRIGTIRPGEVMTKGENVTISLINLKLFDPLYNLIPPNAFPVDATQPVWQPAAVQLDGPPWEVCLPNGVVVELAGLAESPSTDKAWFGLDGKPLADRPYTLLSAPFGGRISEGYRTVELAYRLRVPDRSQEGPTFLEPMNKGGIGLDTISNRERVWGIEGVAVMFHEGQETLDIRIGAASGPWRPIGSGVFDAEGTVQSFVLDDGYGVLEFAGPQGGANHELFSVVMDKSWRNINWRFTTTDETGKAHQLDGGIGTSVKDRPGLRRHDFAIRPPTRARLVTLRLEVRPFYYAEFQNVSLLPGKKTDIRVVTGIRGESPTTQPAETARLIEQLASDDAAEREAAKEALVETGWAAVSALRDAQMHKDPDVAARAEAALKEILARIEARRDAARAAAEQAARQDDPAAARRAYLDLLALPRAQLRDARAAIRFFEAGQDRPALAEAYEVAAQAMWRATHTPVGDFIRPAEEVPDQPDRVIAGGPTVQVQVNLDGEWHNCNGTGEDWTDWLQRQQRKLVLERIATLEKLGELCMSHLDAPARAVAAYRAAGRGVPLCTEPLKTLIPQMWPKRTVKAEEVLAAGDVRPADQMAHIRIKPLSSLADAQVKAGDLRGAAETRIRAMLCMLIPENGDWNAHGSAEQAEAFWQIVRALPADEPLPPTLWLHVLERDRPEMDFPAPEEGPHGLPFSFPGPRLVIRPGQTAETLTVSAEMETHGGDGGVRCFTMIDGKVHDLGWVQWSTEEGKSRQWRSATFDLPEAVGIICLEITPWGGSDFHVRALKVSATFADAQSDSAPSEEPSGAESVTQPETQSSPGAAEIARLIEQLASDDAAEREAAKEALVKIGEPAMEPLRVATRAGSDGVYPERERLAALALTEIVKDTAEKETHENEGPLRLTLIFNRQSYVPTENIYDTFILSTSSEKEVAFGLGVELSFEVRGPDGVVQVAKDSPPQAFRISRDKPLCFTDRLQGPFDVRKPGAYEIVARFTDPQHGYSVTTQPYTIHVVQPDDEEVISTREVLHRTVPTCRYELVKFTDDGRAVFLLRRQLLNVTLPKGAAIGGRRIDADGLEKGVLAEDPAWIDGAQGEGWKIALPGGVTLVASVPRGGSGAAVVWRKIPLPPDELVFKQIGPKDSPLVVEDSNGVRYVLDGTEPAATTPAAQPQIDDAFLEYIEGLAEEPGVKVEPVAGAAEAYAQAMAEGRAASNAASQANPSTFAQPEELRLSNWRKSLSAPFPIYESFVRKYPLTPEGLKTLSLLGVEYARMGHPEEGARLLTAALKLARGTPIEGILNINLAWAQMEAGQLDAAEMRLREIMRLAPPTTSEGWKTAGVTRFLAQTHLAEVEAKRGRLAEADELLTAVADTAVAKAKEYPSLSDFFASYAGDAYTKRIVLVLDRKPPDVALARRLAEEFRARFPDYKGPAFSYETMLTYLRAATPPAGEGGKAADEGDAAETADTETATVELSGRVVDDETGELVKGFALQRGWPDPKDPSKILWGGFGYSSLHESGSFSEREGTYKGRKLWLRVLADGYVPQPVTPEPLTAPAGAQNLEVRLKRGLEVRGRVVDHAGKAVADAKVFLGGYQGLELVDDKAERFYCSTTTTDKDGAFVLAGVGEGADSIIVSAPSLHVWRVPLTKPDEEILITLPEPATLVLRYDIEGDEDPGQFRLELKTWEMKDWKGVVTSVQNPTVPNKGTTALSNVTPGVYDLVRMKQPRVGRESRGVLCDRRTITLDAGKTTEVEFVRKTGHPITGEVVGLKEAGVPGAVIYVKPAAATGDPRKTEEWKLTLFDAVTCGEDGQFKTARIPPSTYAVIVYAYNPEPPTGVFYTGERLPDFIGTAKVTVTEDAPPPPVRIELKPRPGAWGKAVDGAYCRLRADKLEWKVGETPTFKADVWNRGERELLVYQSQSLCELEFDGQWYAWAGEVSALSSVFGPGRYYTDIPIALDEHWQSKQGHKPLPLSVGKHTVRIAFTAKPSKPGEEAPVRFVSNRVEIEIVPAEAATEAEQATLYISMMPSAETVKTLDELDVCAVVQGLNQDAAKTGEWEIRTADNTRRIARLPYNWPIREEQLIPNSNKITGGTERPGRFGLSKQQVRSIGPIEDGAYLLGWYVGGKRCSNVVRFQIGKEHDVRNEPLLKLVEIEPGPDQELPFLGIRAYRHTKDDPAFAAWDVAYPMLNVNGRDHIVEGIVWSGPGPLKPGGHYTYILDLRRYRPPLEPGKKHVIIAKIGEHESNPLTLTYDRTLSDAWDAATGRLPAAEAASSVSFTSPAAQPADSCELAFATEGLTLEPYPDGGLYTVTALIENKGSRPAGRFGVRFYYRGRPGSSRPAEHTAGPIKPNETFGEGTLPFALHEGVNEIFVELDWRNEIHEADETDNKATLEVIVKDGKVVRKTFIAGWPAAQPAEEWGEANNGVQARLRADKHTWAAGQTPSFRADVRNQGNGEYTVVLAQQLCRLELDGVRYMMWPLRLRVRLAPLPPGRAYSDVLIALTDNWVKVKVTPEGDEIAGTDKLQLTPGRHSLRAIFFCHGTSGSTDLVVETNIVEFEIAAAGAAQVGPKDSRFPDLDLGIWNIPLEGSARRAEDNGGFYVIDLDFPAMQPWVVPADVGLAADSPKAVAAEKARKGDMCVIDAETVEGIRGCVLAPLALPPPRRMRHMQQIVYDGVKDRSLYDIAAEILAWRAQHADKTSIRLEPGKHYAALRPDGKIVIMGAHGKAGGVWVQFIPIGSLDTESLAELSEESGLVDPASTDPDAAAAPIPTCTLEFRIAPKLADLDEAELASYMDWLKAGKVGFWWKDGRVAGISGPMPDHAWLPIFGERRSSQQLVTGEYDGQRYMLVSDKAGETMVPGEGNDAWGLAKAYATKDGGGQPAIGFELDAHGAELFAALTKANINNALAVVIDGKVISAPIIKAALSKTGIIIGQFTEQEVDALVEALRAGMPPTGQPASRSSSPAARISGVVRDATSQCVFDEEFLKKLPEVKSDDEFLKLAQTRPKAKACSKITVHLRGQTAEHQKITLETVTDDQGDYTFDDLPQGDYEVWAERQSSPAEADATAHTAMARATVRVGIYPGPDFQPNGGDPVYRADLNLRRDVVTVRGRVTDAKGNPVAGATVVCRNQLGKQDPRREVREGDRWLERTSASAVTDAEGAFELRGIDPPEMYPTAGYLNGGSPPEVMRLFDVQADGFEPASRSIPLVTEELLDKSRRLLAVMRQLQQEQLRAQPSTRPVEIVGEKPERTQSLPTSSGNVITGTDFTLQPGEEAREIRNTGDEARAKHGDRPTDAAHHAFKEALDKDLSFGVGEGRTQPAAIRAWEEFLECDGRSKEQELFAMWRIASLCAYNMDPQRNEKPDDDKAMEFLVKARAHIPGLVCEETINATTVYAGMWGDPIERAARKAECYRWFRTRTDEMVKNSAATVSRTGSVVDLDFYRQPTFPPQVSLEKKEALLRFMLRDGEDSMLTQIKEFMEWNDDPAAATMLLSSIEDIADPAHLELWRNTKNRWDSE